MRCEFKNSKVLNSILSKLNVSVVVVINDNRSRPYLIVDTGFGIFLW